MNPFTVVLGITLGQYNHIFLPRCDCGYRVHRDGEEKTLAPCLSRIPLVWVDRYRLVLLAGLIRAAQ